MISISKIRAVSNISYFTYNGALLVYQLIILNIS